MPIYEYRCRLCGKIIERIGKADVLPKLMHITHEDEKGEECLATSDRIISKSSFQLKGGGWAKDGYGPSSGG